MEAPPDSSHMKHAPYRRLSVAAASAALLAACGLAACSHGGYALRPVPRIAAEEVGQPVADLERSFGLPRKVDATSTKLVYVWFLEQVPAGAPPGLHGCEMEVAVDPRTRHVLGYSLSNIGWAKCGEVQRTIRVAER